MKLNIISSGNGAKVPDLLKRRKLEWKIFAWKFNIVERPCHALLTAKSSNVWIMNVIKNRKSRKKNVRTTATHIRRSTPHTNNRTVLSTRRCRTIPITGNFCPITASATAPQRHSTTAPQHHSATAPQHHSATAHSNQMRAVHYGAV